MECEPMLEDHGYGCTCDSETVIFCFDKKTGEYEWSCSGSCFKRVPKESIATQTENTAQYSPLQFGTGTLTQYKGNSGTKLNSPILNASDVCEEDMEKHVVPNNTTSSEADQVIPHDEYLGQSLSDFGNDQHKTHDGKDFNDNGDNDGANNRNIDNDVAGGIVADSEDGDDDDNGGAGDRVVDSGDHDDDDSNVAGNRVDDGDNDDFDGGVDDDDDDFDGGVDEDDDDDDDDDDDYVYIVDDDSGSDDDDGDDDDDGPIDVHVSATADECQNRTTKLNSNDDGDGEEGDKNPTDGNHVPNPSQKPKKPRKRKQKQKDSLPKETFPCPHCSRNSKSKSAHEKHIEWHTRSKEKKCHICDREFSQPGYLINHLRKHEEAKQQREDASDGIQHSRSKKTGMAECRHCGKLVKRKRIVGHEKAHTPREKRTLECSYCGKICAGSSELSRHERTHTKERPYKCNQCESAFYCQQELNLHIRRHLGDKRYKCDHCGKAFIRKCNLDEHFRTHTGARPFKCNYCDKSFGFKNVLKVHLVRHTGIRPHVCEYCNKGFAKKSFLDKHLLSHQ